MSLIGRGCSGYIRWGACREEIVCSFNSSRDDLATLLGSNSGLIHKGVTYD